MVLYNTVLSTPIPISDHIPKSYQILIKAPILISDVEDVASKSLIIDASDMEAIDFKYSRLTHEHQHI